MGSRDCQLRIVWHSPEIGIGSDTMVGLQLAIKDQERNFTGGQMIFSRNIDQEMASHQISGIC